VAGRQLNFFLGPSDQEHFEQALQAAGPLVIFKSRSPSAAPETLTTTVIARFGEEHLRVLLARPDDLREVRFEPIKGRADYSCNPTYSPIIEFDRCYVSDGLIRPGRLYYIPKYYDEDGKLVPKPALFLKWAEDVFSAARASLREIEGDLFAGAEALELREAGTRLEGVS
jgi:hypothetical protein